MPLDINNAFGVHEQALELRARRAKILAGNLVNADTPNYKARDIDFSAVLSQAKKDGIQMEKTNSLHISPTGMDASRAEMFYRTPLQPSVDGNTVDSQVEQAQFSQNAIHYQATLTFINGRIKGLMTAIRGE